MAIGGIGGDPFDIPGPTPEQQALLDQYRHINPHRTDQINGLEHSVEARVKALDNARKGRSQLSLYYFVQFAWSVLEPGRPFVGGWHIEAICEHLEAVSRGEIPRLLMNVPPGFMKSLTTCVFWPSWEWGPLNLPALRYLFFSYNADLTIRDNRRARQLLESPGYRRLWGDQFQLSGDQNAKVKFDNDHSGYRLATSIGGSSTGWRGDRVVLDDPHSVKEAESEAKREEARLFFTETLPTRMSDPAKSSIVVIMQRVHQHDISGLILTRDLGYEHLNLPMEFEPKRISYTKLKPKTRESEPAWVTQKKPADPVEAEGWQQGQWRQCTPDDEGARFLYPQDIRYAEGELLWPDRFTEEVVERDKKVLGEYAAAGQFQQRPSPRGGGMFDISKISIVKVAPVGGRDVRGYDLAATKAKAGQAKTTGGAYTSGVRMRLVDGAIYIMHVSRKRIGPADVETLIKNTATQDGQRVRISIPQDPGQAGVAQVLSYAKLLHGFDVRFSPESGSKEDRAIPLVSQVEAGNVFLVEGDWNADYLAELETFPRGFKDQVDASTRAYTELLKMKQGPVSIGGGVSIPESAVS